MSGRKSPTINQGISPSRLESSGPSLKSSKSIFAPVVSLPPIREQNRIRNSQEYWRGDVKLNSLPRYLLMELTQGCNLQCDMCRRQRIGINEFRMDLEVFRRVADELFPTAEIVDLRGWGESLLLPDIIDLIRYTHNFGCEIRFVTNLSFRRDAVLTVLSENQCHLSVSLDSADANILSKLRKGASLPRIRKNLQFLVEQYNSVQGDSDRIVINCTVQRPALATLESLVTFAAEVGVKEIRLGSVSVREPLLSLEGCERDVVTALKSVAKAGQKHGVRVVLATHFAGIQECKANSLHCIRPWSFACVNVDGSVGFCDHLIGPLARKHQIGSLKSSSFEEIWNSNPWQELRREHHLSRRTDAQLSSHCDWCYRKRFVEFEDYFFPELEASKVVLSSHCLHKVYMQKRLRV